MIRLGMITVMAGGAVLTAESNVNSSVDSAVPGPQSSLVGVCSGMLGRNLWFSGAYQVSSTLWDAWHVSESALGLSGIFIWV